VSSLVSFLLVFLSFFEDFFRKEAKRKRGSYVPVDDLNTSVKKKRREEGRKRSQKWYEKNKNTEDTENEHELGNKQIINFLLTFYSKLSLIYSAGVFDCRLQLTDVLIRNKTNRYLNLLRKIAEMSGIVSLL
jgi:hypothetical protein